MAANPTQVWAACADLNNGGHSTRVKAWGTAWLQTVDCAKTGQLCTGGACVAAVCKPGTVACDGALAKSCNAAGTAWQESVCAAGSACDQGVCKQQVCAPNQTTCNADHTVVVCSGNGLNQSVAQDCKSQGKVCFDGACKTQTATCTPGSKQCQGGLLATCNPDGQTWAQAVCNDNSPCTTDSCAPGASACSFAAKYCNDGVGCTYDSCNPQTGACTATSDLALCNDGNLCTGDSCNATSGCAHSPVVCSDNNNCTADSCSPTAGCVHTTIAG
ncbi:MAG: hypothetical protein FJ100_07110 [Deltaproteobacteria bacterium]|nr:hypothetical protein [Deltaproteobacteria bacterium]